MGSKIGTIKVAAKKLRLTLEEYITKKDAGMKWCTKGKHWVPISEFAKDASRGDGLKSTCRKCDYVRLTTGPTRKERQEMQAKGLAWCRGCKAWLPSNTVRGGICKPCVNAETRKRYATDHEYRQERRQHAHSRKRGIKPISPEAQDILMEQFEGKCAYCGAPAETWDHIIPVSRGGDSAPDNVVPACSSCNSSKKDQDVLEWIISTGREPLPQFVDRLTLSERGSHD